MRKSTKRKVWPLRGPALPLTEKHKDELSLQLHVAVAAVGTDSGLSAFIQQIMVCTVAMECDKNHDTHSRNLLRTANLMLDKVLKTGEINAKTVTYCKTVASWIDEWIEQGRITYAGLKQAKELTKRLEQHKGV